MSGNPARHSGLRGPIGGFELNLLRHTLDHTRFEFGILCPKAISNMLKIKHLFGYLTTIFSKWRLLCSNNGHF